MKKITKTNERFCEYQAKQEIRHYLHSLNHHITQLNGKHNKYRQIQINLNKFN